MSKPRLILATSASMPNLYPDDAGLLDVLADRGFDPRIEVWNDKNVNWGDAAATVVRSVVDYANHRKEFLQWANSVPRILNQPDILEWSSDKHYLIELEKRGLEIIPTTWIAADKNYSKQQLDARFPALEDFVLKPTVSSGQRDIGRYSAKSADQKRHALDHATKLLASGRDLMLQRYEADIETYGEISFVFLNGLLSHSVEKQAALHPQQENDETIHPVKVTPYEPTLEEMRWVEVLRRAVHSYIRDRRGHDEQMLYLRADMVPDGNGSFRVMEVALADADLYLNQVEGGLENFADAISVRVFW